MAIEERIDEPHSCAIYVVDDSIYRFQMSEALPINS